MTGVQTLWTRRASLATARAAHNRHRVQWTISQRSFFGLGEIAGVLANPGETLRQITETKKMLQDAKQELEDSKELSQIPVQHTFYPLPGFFKREQETKALRRALSGVPSFTCVFGGSSCGKTALLREVLSDGNYHVLFFDLRIAGFADLASLYFSLAMQMERFFVSLKDQDDRFEPFEKESWAFKHDRKAVEKRLEQPDGKVKTADIAHLMEMFQSSLLTYWQFDPAKLEQEGEEKARADKGKKEESMKSRTAEASKEASATEKGSSPRLSGKESKDGKDEEGKEKRPPLKKKTPVFLLDEAHKLPSLIKNDDTMKSLLDAMLVLSKQDRLLHIIHVTSDGFYMHWLRSMNVLQHCLLLTIGDVSYSEARQFYNERMLPDIPTRLRAQSPSFENIFEVFGGKLAHIADFVSDWINSDGKLPIKESSHYLQAYALLNLQLVHAAVPTGENSNFEIYSAVPSFAPKSSETFSAEELYAVLQEMQASGIWEVDYFDLCRRLGALKVDAMVRGRLLELRWTPSITVEGTRSNRELFTGPVLLPTTPVIRFAMQEVLKAREARRSASPNTT